MVNTQIVQNEKNFPFRRLDQTATEVDQDVHFHAAFEYLESHLALFGDSGNHIGRGYTGVNPNHVSLALGGVSSFMLAITTQTRLVTPVNFGSLPLGSILDSPISLIQPFLHLLRIPTTSPLGRLLGRKPPPFQIVANDPNGYLYTRLLLTRAMTALRVHSAKGSLT